METMVVVVMVWLLGVVGLLQVLVVLVLPQQLLVRAIAHQLRHTHTSMSVCLHHVSSARGKE
jgi:hypothetical protein